MGYLQARLLLCLRKGGIAVMGLSTGPGRRADNGEFFISYDSISDGDNDNDTDNSIDEG